MLPSPSTSEAAHGKKLSAPPYRSLLRARLASTRVSDIVTLRPRHTDLTSLSSRWSVNTCPLSVRPRSLSATVRCFPPNEFAEQDAAVEPFWARQPDSQFHACSAQIGR